MKMVPGVLEKLLYSVWGLSALVLFQLAVFSPVELFAQTSDQGFVLRERTVPILPNDYQIGNLGQVDRSSRELIERSLLYLYGSDIAAFERMVAPADRQRLVQRFALELNKSSTAADEQDSIGEPASFDTVRISPVGGVEPGFRVYSLRILAGDRARSGEVWIVEKDNRLLVEDLVLDLAYGELFGDETRRFSPGGARTVW